MSQSPALATSCVDSEPGPLPSTGITRLPRYYRPLRHPPWPSLAVTGHLLETPTSTIEDFPCCARSSSFVHATANTPARLPSARSALFPSSLSLPRIDWQVGPCITLFEACSAFTHVAACTLAKSPSDPLHRRLQPLRYLHDCSDCYRLERKSPGGFRTHWKSAALARRTSNSGVQVPVVSVSRSSWNDCPGVHAITVQVLVESVSSWPWNAHAACSSTAVPESPPAACAIPPC